MKKPLLILAALIALLILIVIVEVLYIRFTGKNVPVPEIPREPQMLGQGNPLRYVIMGDSTSVSQGGSYEQGFAVASAKLLAQKHAVTYINTGVSGATTKTLVEQQLSKAADFKPDIVLLAIGANDVTHLVPFDEAKRNLQQVVDTLRVANPNVQIVFTRSPAVDAVSRFPVGAKQLIKWRVVRYNQSLTEFIADNRLVVAPVAEKTRQAFLDDPSLLAADKFHPNDRGYALWIPVINEAIEKVQYSHE